jgi:murein L,D-transpeptidase YafK
MSLLINTFKIQVFLHIISILMQKLITGILIAVVGAALIYYFYPEPRLQIQGNISRILVIKSKRQLIVYKGDSMLKIYKISLGRNPLGKKEISGDRKTPEGLYRIIGKSSTSRFYKNLKISYPNDMDVSNAEKQNRGTGGDIMIHGMRNGFGFIGKFHRFIDWTSGCIALTDNEMDELYNHVVLGTPIEITP